MSRFLALDADARGLFVAAARLKAGGGVALERALALADDAARLGPATAADVGAKLKELLGSAGVKPAPVLVCLGRDRIILKDVRYPETPPADEPMVVRFQAVKDLTENPDDVLMDYTPLAGRAPSGEKRATAVFVRKDVYQAARTAVEAAGLKLAGVTPRPFVAAAALRHAFAGGAAAPPDDPAAPVAVVTLWERGGEFTVVRGSEVAFTRAVPAAALSSEASLTAELRRNLAVFAGQNPTAPVAAVYVAESDEPGVGWSGRLAETLPVPVQAFDPTAGAASDLVPAALRGRFAGPVGLLAARAAGATAINFVAPRQPRAEPSKARGKVVIAALAGLLVVGMIGGYAFLRIQKANREVARLTAERDDLDQQLALHELDAKRLAAADEFTNREVVWLDTLYDLTDVVPDVGKAAVAEFQGEALPPPKQANRPGPGVGPQPAGGPAAAAAPVAAAKNAPPPPVAKMTVTLRTADASLAQRVFDAIKNDKYTIKIDKQVSPQGDANSRQQQYVITVQLAHRKPEEYSRRLSVRAPERGDDEGGFGGGFGGFGGGFAP